MISKTDEKQKLYNRIKKYVADTLPLLVYVIIFVTVSVLIVYKFRNSIFN